MARKKKKTNATMILGIAAIAAGAWYLIHKSKAAVNDTTATKTNS